LLLATQAPLLKKLAEMIYRILFKFIWFLRNFRKIKPNSQLYCYGNEKVTYNQDALATSNNCDFINEDNFKTAYQLAANTKPWDNFASQWRYHIILWYAKRAAKLEGDFVECGVNTGGYAKAIISYLNFNEMSKTFYLLDTFEGLDKTQITIQEFKNGIGHYLNEYKNVYNQVLETFKGDNVKIVKGLVPDTLREVDTQKICYLSLDMNVAFPEVAALHYFWDKLVPGAVIVHDDYGFANHFQQKLEIDKFAQEKGVDVLCLPTGQAIIIKP
jgi:O-methyltransferase